MNRVQKRLTGGAAAGSQTCIHDGQGVSSDLRNIDLRLVTGVLGKVNLYLVHWFDWRVLCAGSEYAPRYECVSCCILKPYETQVGHLWCCNRRPVSRQPFVIPTVAQHNVHRRLRASICGYRVNYTCVPMGSSGEVESQHPARSSQWLC
jgi:hypothetical protein